MSNVERSTQFIPQITKGHLDLLYRMTPRIERIDDIKVYDCAPEKVLRPTGLWEFKVTMSGVGYAVIFMSVDGRVVGTCFNERTGSLRRNEIPKTQGVGYMQGDWTNTLHITRKENTVELREDGDYMSLGPDYQHNIYNKVKAWAKQQIHDRVWESKCDLFGASWDEEKFPLEDRCPICGQPDEPWIGAQNMCEHTKITEREDRILRGRCESCGGNAQVEDTSYGRRCIHCQDETTAAKG